MFGPPCGRRRYLSFAGLANPSPGFGASRPQVHDLLNVAFPSSSGDAQ
jgi:hypothetical protein